MSGFIPLDELLMRRDPSMIVAYRQERAISWYEFMQHVAVTSQKLDHGSNWVLVCDDTYWFAVGFFALLYANKKVILPTNGLPQTIAELPESMAGLLTDSEQVSHLCTIHLPSIIKDEKVSTHAEFSALKTDYGSIELFTSGSTGVPQKITKTLANLSAELESLEGLWGESLTNSVILATVSHQHIYGLLFRLLWPLCSGRAFVDFHFEYPETLLAYAQKLNKQGINTVLISSPAHLKRMTQLINISELKPGIKKIFSSGGPLSQQTALEFKWQFEQAPIEVFGSTETGGVAYRQQAHEDAPQSWQPFDVVGIQCREPDNVLLVKSPYINSDDWFVMGDKIKLLDGQGFLLQGRVDRVVKVEEKRLSLSEMERRLNNMSWVEEAKLLIISGDREQVACVVILSQQGETLLAENGRRMVSQKLRELLSDHYEKVVLPRKWRYVNEFPHNSQGKITQQDLTELFVKEAIS